MLQIILLASLRGAIYQASMSYNLVRLNSPQLLLHWRVTSDD